MPIFSFLLSFQHSWQKTNVKYFFLKTSFEPLTSGVWSATALPTESQVLNGPNLAFFVLFLAKFYRKKLGFSGTQTWIVKEEG